MRTAVVPARRPVAAVATMLLALLVTLVLPTAPAAADIDGGAESEFVAAINKARADAGMAPLSVSGDLQSPARSWSVHMADEGELSHSDVRNRVSGWQRVGENVGYGASVSSIHNALMNSSSHRANILGDFTQVGVGVERRGGELWVSQIFRKPKGASSPQPEPEPEPEPKPKPTASSTPAASSSSSSSSTPAQPAATTTPTPQEASDPLPPVEPDVDRALIMLTRTATADASLDALAA